MSSLPAQSRRPSPRRPMSSSAIPHLKHVAYPFPRLTIVPKAPILKKDDELTPYPKRQKLPINRNWIVPKWIGILVLFVLFSIIYFVTRSGKKVRATDRIPFTLDLARDYFNQFEGHQECGIDSRDIYIPPISRHAADKKHALYCPNRAKLLNAMSGGGRHGFDKPYFPVGCHFRWYSTSEICMILERFDSVVFLGDDSLRHIYSAFNMLLRENIDLGGLKQWEMKEAEREICRCENQLVRPECMQYTIMDSQSVRENDVGSGHSSPYFCDRATHMFLSIDRSPAPEDLHTKFTSNLVRNIDSYKPLPVIHSLSLSTSLSWSTATASMDEWVTLADISQRNVPFLWVGPNAAGHLKPPGQILSQGNNALWHYTIEMAKEARNRELDSLGMYNLTLQARSWDGSFYGQNIALTQAMMIINWLSRLEST